MSARTVMEPEGYRSHRMALERWRDAFAAYLASAPDYAAGMDANMEELTVAADEALRIASFDVAAQDEGGAMEHGLVRALPLIMLRNARIEREHRKGDVFRTARVEAEFDLIESDVGATKSLCVPFPLKKRVNERQLDLWEGLFGTIDDAIGYLKECER